MTDCINVLALCSVLFTIGTYAIVLGCMLGDMAYCAYTGEEGY